MDSLASARQVREQLDKFTTPNGEWNLPEQADLVIATAIDEARLEAVYRMFREVKKPVIEMRNYYRTLGAEGKGMALILDTALDEMNKVDLSVAELEASLRERGKV